MEGASRWKTRRAGKPGEVTPGRLATLVLMCRRGTNPKRGAKPLQCGSAALAGSRSEEEDKATGGWAKESHLLGPGSSRECLEAIPAMGNGMEAALNQYRDTATVLNTPKATPTSWELAFVMVTLRRQLAEG